MRLRNRSNGRLKSRRGAPFCSIEALVTPRNSTIPSVIHHCVDCSALSPPTDPERSSIGENAAWRLTRQPTRDGRIMLEWRCPPCWTEHWKRRQSA
jgi:hypothetical protein